MLGDPWFYVWQEHSNYGHIQQEMKLATELGASVGKILRVMLLCQHILNCFLIKQFDFQPYRKMLSIFSMKRLLSSSFFCAPVACCTQNILIVWNDIELSQNVLVICFTISYSSTRLCNWEARTPTESYLYTQHITNPWPSAYFCIHNCFPEARGATSLSVRPLC